MNEDCIKVQCDARSVSATYSNHVDELGSLIMDTFKPTKAMAQFLRDALRDGNIKDVIHYIALVQEELREQATLSDFSLTRIKGQVEVSMLFVPVRGTGQS